MGYPPRLTIFAHPGLVWGWSHLHYQKLRTFLFLSSPQIFQTFQLFLFHQTSNFLVPFSSICITFTKSKSPKTQSNSIIDSSAKIKGTHFLSCRELLIGIKRKPSEAEIEFGEELIRKMNKESSKSISRENSISDGTVILTI